MKHKTILAAATYLVAASAFAQGVWRPVPASSITDNRVTSIFVMPVPNLQGYATVEQLRAAVGSSSITTGVTRDPFNSGFGTYIYICRAPGIPSFSWGGAATQLSIFEGGALVLRGNDLQGQTACTDGRDGLVASVLVPPRGPEGTDGPQ